MNNEEDDQVGDLPVLGRRPQNASDESSHSGSSHSTSTGSGLTNVTTPDVQLGEEAHDHKKPDDLEAKFYYFGLPTRPPLVARTGTDPWTIGKPPKALGNVGPGHRLARIWPSVVREVMRVLQPLEWVSIDLLRVGHQGTEEKTWPVTLMVAVAPGTSWERAFPVAVACKDVLRASDVHDVECEMRVSVTQHFAAAKLTTADAMVGRPGRERYLSECAGQPISPCALPRFEGMLGLYVAVGPNKEMCALTCRHVVMGTLEKEAALNEPIRETSFRRGVAQPGSNTFDGLLRLSTNIAKQRGQEDSFLKKLKAAREIDDRRIGHVLFSPPRTLDTDNWLHDWLLVKLDPRRYADLSALKNWIWVGSKGYETMLGYLRRHVKVAVTDDQCMVRLKGIVPKAEILRTTAENDETKDHKALWVHMLGRTDNFTTGISNEVCSVRRVKAAADSDGFITTTEWCVVGRNSLAAGINHGVDSRTGRLYPFSTVGDSGSAVFDSEGRIAGMLTSGVGYNADRLGGTNNYFDYADVSYVTPIEVILGAIRAKFGHASIP